MLGDLTEKHRKEMEALKNKYESMLDELRRNASSDKEFVQMELQRRITELEAEMIKLKGDHADEKNKMVED